MSRIQIVNYKFSDSKGGDHRVQNLAKGLNDLGLDEIFISIYGISNNLEKIKYENRGTLVRKYFDLLMKHKILEVISNASLNTFMLMVHIMRYHYSGKEFSIGIVSVPVLFKLIPFLLKKPQILVVDFGDLWSRYTYIFHKLSRGKNNKNIINLLTKLYTFIEEIINLKILSILCKICNMTIITVPTKAMDIFLRKYNFSNVYFLHHPVDVYLGFDIHINAISNESLNIIVFSSSDLRSNEELEVIAKIGDIIRENSLKGKIFIISPDPEEERKRLSKYVGSNNLIVLPILKRRDYLKLLGKIHLAIVLEPESVSKISIVPRHISKVAEFSCLGIPIITNSLALKDYIINGYNGYIVSLSEVPIIMQSIKNNLELFYNLRVNSLKFCKERLFYRRVAFKLLGFILQTIMKESQCTSIR